MSTFELTAEQDDKINEWVNNHDCPITYEGAIGGKISYQFTPTSIGVAESVVCGCGAELNVTNYDEW